MNHTPRDLRDMAERAVRLHQEGKLDAAASAYHALLALFPGHGAALHNLGVIAAVRGDHETAIGYLDGALTANARYLPAHFHRAVSLEKLGRLDEAVQAYRQVCRLDPGHYGAHRRLGFLWLGKGEIGRALDHYSRTYELRRGEDRSTIAHPSLTSATRDKLRHDSEQFRFLANAYPDRRRFAELARAYGKIAADFPKAPRQITAEQFKALGEDYNTSIHVADAPELPGDVLACGADADAAGLDLNAVRATPIVLDDFLSPAALGSLQNFLLRSTIWHDFTHIEGHVASYLEDGLACPLLLQIADEVRRGFRGIFAGHSLSQAWAFKGLNEDSVIGAHADDAVVSVNLWVAPEAAQATAEGGLIICLEEPPPEWRIESYDKDESQSAQFMDRHTGNSLKVAYRENRAVIFDSRLLHRSDSSHFAPGYENYRINITLLYGTGMRSD